MRYVYIYGSCTTRDSVEYWDQFGFELEGYVARQSLISASVPVSTEGVDLTGIPSSFQRRMVKHDYLGTAVRESILQARKGNLVFWDLTDERNGVVDTGHGQIISGVAANTKGLIRPTTQDVKIEFGTQKFRSMWQRAAEQFAENAGEARSRIIVNAVPWAAKFSDGKPVGDSFPGRAIFNEELEWMCDTLDSLGFPISALLENEVHADPEHVWGPAPFHYDEMTYLTMCRTLEKNVP